MCIVGLHRKGARSQPSLQHKEAAVFGIVAVICRSPPHLPSWEVLQCFANALISVLWVWKCKTCTWLQQQANHCYHCLALHSFVDRLPLPGKEFWQLDCFILKALIVMKKEKINLQGSKYLEFDREVICTRSLSCGFIYYEPKVLDTCQPGEKCIS